MGLCGSNEYRIKSPSPIPPKDPTPPPPTPTPPPPPPRENTEDFAADRVNVQIDQGGDEINFEDNLKGYPAPSAPGDQVGGQAGKRKNVWFEDDEFNLASDDADLFDVEIGDDNNDVDDLDDISIAPSQKQRSACPVSLKYDKIDENAKNASADVRESFDKLLQYLTSLTDDDRYRKTLLARAIIVWMSAQPLDKNNYGEANRESPNGLLQSLKNKTMTYATCYAIICRKAGLQCVRVKGYVKAAGYEPGDKEIPDTTWNAVFVENGWQIVHPYWICRALFGHNLGGWVKVEKDGQAMHTKENASAGIVRNTFHDRYFMPDPEEFVYECCAIDTAWQLVKEPVKSMAEFAKKPYLLPPFFGVGLKLKSEHKCEIESKDGFCKIEMKGSPANAHMLVLRYELFYKSNSSDTAKVDDQQSRMVFNLRASDIFTFDVRFLNVGVYKLVVYGGPLKSPALRLCETKLVCNKQMTGRNLLPLSCPKIGWGPGPFSVEAGLLMPSRISGLIGVSKVEKKAEIAFHLQDTKTQFSAYVHGEVGGRTKAIDDSITITKSEKDKHLKIIANIPNEGEYGVAINVKGKEERNVCNYLLSTYAFQGTKANVKNAKKRLHEQITNNVDPSQWSKKIDEIEDCITKCKREKIPDTDEDMIVAENELNLLKCRNKLRDCDLRQNLNVTRNTLKRVYKYKNKSLLKKEIQAVQRLEEKLIAQQGFAAVPNLKDASHRMANLLHCQNDVKSILEAVFIIVGVSQTTAYDWDSLLVHLKRNRTSLVKRMNRLKSTQIPRDRIQKVKNILNNVDADRIRRVNIDAYRFYKWITDLSIDVK